MKDNILEIKNLEIQYVVDKDVVRAVNNIDLTIGKGEVVGLVGETGAGKTTTALSVLRLLPRYITKIPNGEILFKGENLMDKTEAEMRQIRGQHISMIFQDPMTALNPVMPVGQQIADVIKWHDKDLSNDEVDRQVCEIIEKVGIPAERRNEYPHQFSGGMKQRIVIATAIACNPELLIADEPTTALDVTIQAQVIKMMRELQRELGSSVLMITHDLGIVANFCDKVMIMYAGEIVESGTLEEVFDHDREHHPYTKGLFGSIPDINSKADRLQPIPGLMPDPSNLPEGCKFNPRCPYKMDCCLKGEVPVIDNNGHLIKCHLNAGKE